MQTSHQKLETLKNYFDSLNDSELNCPSKFSEFFKKCFAKNIQSGRPFEYNPCTHWNLCSNELFFSLSQEITKIIGPFNFETYLVEGINFSSGIDIDFIFNLDKCAYSFFKVETVMKMKPASDQRVFVSFSLKDVYFVDKKIITKYVRC